MSDIPINRFNGINFRNSFEVKIAKVLDSLAIDWRYYTPGEVYSYNRLRVMNDTWFELHGIKVCLFPEPIRFLPTENNRVFQDESFRGLNICVWDDGIILNFLNGDRIATAWCSDCEKVFFTRVKKSPYFKRLHGDKTRITKDFSSKIKALYGIGVTPKGQLFNEEGALTALKDVEIDQDILLNTLRGVPFSNSWPAAEQLTRLENRHPNKREVMDLVFSEFKLSPYKKNSKVSLPNILLVGAPACGKTTFAKELGSLLSPKNWKYYDLGQGTTFFTLVGTDKSFKRAKPGLIFHLFSGPGKMRPCENPLLILDEIDKIPRSNNEFDPLPALQSICDKKSAERFRDEYMDVEMNASGLTVIALANDIYDIPKPLLSRFKVFMIPNYTEEEFVGTVIPNIYKEWLENMIPGVFPETISQETVKEIAEVSENMARNVSREINNLVIQGHHEIKAQAIREEDYLKHRETLQTERLRPHMGMDSESGLIPLSASLRKKLELREKTYVEENLKGHMATALISEDDELPPY